MSDQEPLSDGPTVQDDDSLETRTSDRLASDADSVGSMGSQVRHAISQMAAVGPDAESKYQDALAGLTANPDSAVPTVSQLYGSTPEEDYRERWAYVHLLNELATPSALGLFGEILSTPIPPERSPEMITYSTVGEETIIRTTAIEGVEQLAAQGNADARQMLLEQTQHESLSVRRAAVQGYLAVAGPDARDELLKALPVDQHFLLDIRRASVQEVPQPTVDAVATVVDQPPPIPPLEPPKGEE